MRCFSFVFCLFCLIVSNPSQNIHSFSPCMQLRLVLIVFMFSVAANWKLRQILSWAKRRVGVPSRAFRWFGSRKVLICTPLIQARPAFERKKERVLPFTLPCRSPRVQTRPSRSCAPFTFSRAHREHARLSNFLRYSSSRAPFTLTRGLDFPLLSFRAPGDIQMLCALEEVIIFQPRIKQNLEAPPHTFSPLPPKKTIKYQTWFVSADNIF